MVDGLGVRLKDVGRWGLTLPCIEGRGTDDRWIKRQMHGWVDRWTGRSAFR